MSRHETIGEIAAHGGVVDSQGRVMAFTPEAAKCRSTGHEGGDRVFWVATTEIKGLEGIDRHRRDIDPALYCARRLRSGPRELGERFIAFELVGEDLKR